MDQCTGHNHYKIITASCRAICVILLLAETHYIKNVYICFKSTLVVLRLCTI